MADKDWNIALILCRKIGATIYMYTESDSPDIWKIEYKESSKLVDMFWKVNITLAIVPQDTDTLTNIEKLR